MRRLVILTLTFYVLFLVTINAFNDKEVVKNYDYCANQYSQIVFKNNLFFAIGQDGRIKASSDGMTWKICETGITDSITDIEWNGKYYVAAGYDSILISYDGFNWKYKGSTEFFFYDVFWDGNKFIATGGQLVSTSIDAGVVAWSKDGINWSVLDVDFKEKSNLETFGYSFLYQDGIYYLLGHGFDSITDNESATIFTLVSKDGLTWKQSEDTSIISNNYNDTYELSGNGISIKFKLSSHELYISTNQKTWRKVAIPDKYNLIDATYGNDKFVLLDFYGRILTSEDAENWIETERKNSGINSMIFTGDKFVAVGDNGRILVSSDGQTWDIVQLNENYIIYNVAYKTGIFVAVGYISNSDFNSINSNGLILTSADGINWNSKELKSDYGLTRVIYQYGQFKVYSGDNYITNYTLEYTSDNGYAWKPIHQKNKAFIYKTATNGKNFLALTGNTSREGGLLISKDGVKWDRLYIRMYSPENLNPIHYSDVLWNGKEYIVVGLYLGDDNEASQGIIFSSEDGYTWRCLNGLTNYSIGCAAYGFGRTIAFSSEGLLLTITNKNKDTSTLTKDDNIYTFTEPYNYSKFTNTKKDN